MLDVIGESIIFTVLNLIGGTIRWLVVSFLHLIFNTTKRPYKSYIYHPDDETMLIDGTNGCLNTVVGIACIIIVVMFMNAL